MHYIKRDIFVFKVNLHSFKKEKSFKNAKKTQNMVNFFIVNVQKKHENFFYFNDNSFSFFYVTNYTLVYNVVPGKMFKMCF